MILIPKPHISFFKKYPETKLKMKQPFLFPGMLFFLLLHHSAVIAQQSLTNAEKSNTLQLLNYKPQKAKSGKDGSERLVIFKLFKGPKSGTNGKDGKPGPGLRVDISMITIADTGLLRLVITQKEKKSKPDTFYLNPRYGQIKVIADGGDGGNGGRGESDSGSHGRGGKGGTGGQIEVFFDAGSVDYATCKCLVFSNEGGSGGWSGENYGNAAETGIKGPPIYFKDLNSRIILGN